MNFIAWLIVASEIAFWIVIIAGLAARYIFQLKRLGFFLLALTPVIDLVLLITSTVDLFNGAEATWAHGLAAVYIGISLIFGKSMIQWADERFRYYFLKQGEKPAKRYGMKYAVHQLKGFCKHVIAYILGSGYLLALILIIDDYERTEALYFVITRWLVVLGIDFVITVSYFIWPKEEKVSRNLL